MNFSHFFVRRPIFAGVLSVVIFLLGLIAMRWLPISEYPEVVPPTIVVRATYPGANPKTIAETVASPLEQAVNGVENSLYMFSQATGDGVMTLTVTFKLGTDIDLAQVQVQNRVSQALPKLPEEVRRLGVTTTKQSPDLTMVVHLFSPNGRYDEVYLRNYAVLQVKDVLARIPGAGDVEVFGSGDYAMRVWLDPDKIAARNLTASDVVSAIREQNVQVAAGAIGQQPVSSPVDFELQVNAKGRLISTEEFGQIIVKTGANGEKTLLKDVARIELGAAGYSRRSLLDTSIMRADAIDVVDNVERTIALGLSPFDATKRAMNEVTGPIAATALVLCAVFVPTAFISGLTGQFYKQFAITIAISTVISAFNSLTLSPALCAVLLKEHGAPKDWFARSMDRAFGWFFRPFNRVFAWSGNRYAAGVSAVLRKSAIALIVYGGL